MCWIVVFGWFVGLFAFDFCRFVWFIVLVGLLGCLCLVGLLGFFVGLLAWLVACGCLLVYLLTCLRKWWDEFIYLFISWLVGWLQVCLFVCVFVGWLVGWLVGS